MFRPPTRLLGSMFAIKLQTHSFTGVAAALPQNKATFPVHPAEIVILQPVEDSYSGIR